MTRRAEALWTAAAGVVALAIAAWVLRLWQTRLDVPWAYSEDGLQIQATVKAVLDHGWYLGNPDLGAPFGAHLQDFPFASGDSLQLLIIKVLGVFTGDAVTVTNLMLLLSFVLAGAVGFAVMRALGARRGPAFVCAVLFALLPYHFRKGEFELFLSLYYGVPLGVLLIVRVARGEARWSRGTLALCVVVGCTSVYYASFTVLMIVVAAALRRSQLRQALALLAAIGATIFVNQLPTTIYHLRHGGNPAVAKRPAINSETYALKLDTLVFPIADHRFGPAREFSHRYNAQSQSDPPSNLGLVGSVGFVWLVLVALASAFGRRTDEEERTLGTLALSAFLIATVGGVSAVIAFTLTTQIRVWDRMGIMIGFLGLLAVALRLGRLRPKRPLAVAGLALLLAVGALDQTSPAMAPDYGALRSQYRAYSDLVGRIEAELPAGAAILTLPYQDYPESTHQWAEGNYQHVRPYLSSTDLRWSFGAMRNRRQDWQGTVSEYPLPTMLDAAAGAGFAGVWVDTAAWADRGAALAGALDPALGPSLASPDGRLRFYDLRPYAGALRERLGPARWARLVAAARHPVRAVYAGGFGERQDGGTDRWRWAARHAELELDNPRDEPRRVHVAALVRTDAATPGTTRVTLPGGRTLDLAVTAEGSELRADVTVPPGGATIGFDSDGAELSDKGRTVVMQLRNGVVVDTDLCRTQGPACTDGPRPQLY